MNHSDPSYYSSTGGGNLLSKFMHDKRLLALGLLTVFSFLVGVNMLLQSSRNTYKSSAAGTTASINVWPPFIVKTLSVFPTREYTGVRDITDTQTRTGTGYSVKVASDKSWGAFYVQNLLSTPVTLRFVQDCREDLAGFEQCPGWKPGMTATELKTLKYTKDIVVNGNQIVSVYAGVQCWPYQLDITSPFSHGRNIPPGGSCSTTTPPPTTITPPPTTITPPTKTPTKTLTPVPAPISCVSLQYFDENTYGYPAFLIDAKDSSGSTPAWYAYRITNSQGTIVKSGYMNTLPHTVNATGMVPDTYKAYVAQVGEGTNPPQIISAYFTSPACQYSFPGITPPTATPTPQLSCASLTRLGSGSNQFSVKVNRSLDGTEDVYYAKIDRNGSTVWKGSGQDVNEIIATIDPVESSTLYKAYVAWSLSGPWSGGTACTYNSPTGTVVSTQPTPPSSTQASCVNVDKVYPTDEFGGAENAFVNPGDDVWLTANVYRSGSNATYRVMKVDANGNYLSSTPVVPVASIPYAGVAGNIKINFAFQNVELYPVRYSFEVNSGSGFIKDGADGSITCTKSYLTTPTITITPTKTKTPTPTPTLSAWRFVGCYKDPHCWHKTASATTTPSWQSWPASKDTYHPQCDPKYPDTTWCNGRRTAVNHTDSSGKVTKIEYNLYGNSTKEQIITDIYINGSKIDINKIPVNSSSPTYYKDDRGSVVLFVNKSTCTLADGTKTCLNPQVWWRHNSGASGILVTLFNQIISNASTLIRWP